MVISGVYDVVVVGAGIMGSCTAYQVAKQGHSVLLVEQFDFLHRRGSSHGETRTIRLTYPEDYYTFMMAEAFRLWEEAQQEAGFLVHTKTAQLDMGPSEHKSLQAVISSCIKHGIKVDVLTPTEASVRFPVLELPQHWIAVVTEQGGVIHASKAVAMFQLLAAKHGAVLRDRTKVRRISSGWKRPNGNDGVLVTTSQGAVLGGKCVIAAGAWTSKLVREMFGLELPIEPLHTTLAYWQIDEKELGAFSVSSGFPSFAVYGDPYLYGNASIELPGLIKVSLHSGYNCDPDNRALVPDVKTLSKIVGPWLATHFKGKIKSDSPVLAEACMYSITPDQDFIIDFLPTMNQHNTNSLGSGHKCESLLVAGGFSGHGFKMGPLVGRVLADLCLSGVSEGVPLEYFCIGRFSRSPRGNSKHFEEQVLSYANHG